MDEVDVIYQTIVSKLIKLFGSDCLAEEWLLTPHPDLNDTEPIELIKEGSTKELLHFIDSLEGKYLVH